MTAFGLISAFGGFQNIGQRTKKTWVNGENRVKSTINSGWNNNTEYRIERPSPLIYIDLNALLTKIASEMSFFFKIKRSSPSLNSNSVA